MTDPVDPAVLDRLRAIYGEAAVEAWLRDPELHFAPLSKAQSTSHARNVTDQYIGRGIIITGVTKPNAD